MKKAFQMYDRNSLVSTLEVTEGERSEPQGAERVLVAPDPEVSEKPTRRKFSAEYKLHILGLGDSCTEPGSLGRLLRKEGLYSSNLSAWLRQRDNGVLEVLQPAKRGRKASEPNPLLPEIEKLRKENQRLEKRLKRAEIIISRASDPIRDGNEPAWPFHLKESRNVRIAERNQHSVLIESVEFPYDLRFFLEIMRRMGMEHQGDMSMTRSLSKPAS